MAATVEQQILLRTRCNLTDITAATATDAATPPPPIAAAATQPHHHHAATTKLPNTHSRRAYHIKCTRAKASK